MVKEVPKISIVTPSFNQAQFLEATIQSVLCQNYPALEYIIIDGGSTDGSVEIIKKYEAHLYFWCSEPDGGQYDAINKGFAHSTGEIMAWLNSDDMYHPWAFKTVSSIMSELPQVEWLTSLSPSFWDWHGFCTGFGSIPGYSREAFLDGCYVPEDSNTIGWIQQESTFWRRSLWRKIGSYIRTEFKLAGDFDLWTRFFCHTELYGAHSSLSGFRHQLKNRSHQLDQYIPEAKRSLAEMRDLCDWSPDYSRRIALWLKLDRIPKLRSFFTLAYDYIGKRVIREKQESPDSFWRIETYKYYKNTLSIL